MKTERIFLAHWTYSQEEWKVYLRWKDKQRGIFYYLFSPLFRSQTNNLNEVTITLQKVWMGDNVETFRDKERNLKKVQILEMSNLKLLVITYEKIKGKSP